VAALALDHVVIAVSDLEAAMADYRALGFTVVAAARIRATSHNPRRVRGRQLPELIAWSRPTGGALVRGIRQAAKGYGSRCCPTMWQA
jgi:catechol 2,3-dioxygenase-like lactoylglutathione lyase family enzyme